MTRSSTVDHEDLANVLHEILLPYVKAHNLGRVWRPRSVVRIHGSEVEPDLSVGPVSASQNRSWAHRPLPILVVEILSDATRSRGNIQKRKLYADVGILEYWIVDGELRTIRVVRPGLDDVASNESLVWWPAVTPAPLAPLTLDVRAYFLEALG